MSSVLTKYVRLGLANLAPRKSDKTVDVESVRERKAIDPTTRKPTDTIEGYTLNFFGVSGGVQSLKLPLDVRPTVEQINSALQRGAIVKVNFGSPSTLQAKFYAMMSDGQLIQGITASASVVEVVEIIEQDEDFDIEL